MLGKESEDNERYPLMSICVWIIETKDRHPGHQCFGKVVPATLQVASNAQNPAGNNASTSGLMCTQEEVGKM